MFKIKIGVVLAAVVAVFAIFAAPSMAFKEFVAKNTGQVKGRGGSQVFVTNAGTFVCQSTTSEGHVTELKSPQIKATVHYVGCKFLNELAKVSPAEYNFNISGTVSVSNTITVVVVGCTVTVEPTANQNLSKVEYANVSGQQKEVEGHQEVENITYKTSGGLCGASGKNGKYKGSALAGFEKGLGNVEVV
jgi:hypothetical protein